VAEVCSTTPSPAVAAVDTSSNPTALPSELIIARAGPTPIELETASSTAGPGVKVTNSETRRKASQSERAMGRGGGMKRVRRW